MRSKTLLSSLLVAGLAWGLAPKPAQAQASSSELMRQRIHNFNQLAAQNPGWQMHPELLALYWVGLPSPPYRKIESQLEPLESPTRAVVTITEAQLLDDSLAGSRTRLFFSLQQQQWVLTKVEEAWKCRRGADTNSFVLHPCP